ncbi:hypothetical protein [Methanobrevibacter arboriphilus]|uniref:hypothetical protein n=1 Tax=Methanobrevibacter arboriphilus TaxID=39441 RepID=UPI000A8689C0|nr:hypothetical protein [Methanobrevibacter arboriphilus]
MQSIWRKKIFILKEIKEEYIKINGEIDDDFLKDYDEKYKDYSNDFQNFKKTFFSLIFINQITKKMTL